MDTEERRVKDAIKDLEALLDDNSDLQKAIRDARKLLDTNARELEGKIREADDRIKRIEEDTELGKLTRKYENALKIHDEVHNFIQKTQAGLDIIKESWEGGMHAIQDVVKEFQKAISSVFHMERIEIGVHTHALFNNEPLTFTFIGTVGGKGFDIKVGWSPGTALGDVYKAVTGEVLKKHSST